MSSCKRPAEASRVPERRTKRVRIHGDFEQLVELVVGVAKKGFLVHKDMLCAVSAFLDAACKPEWTQLENIEHPIICLPEDDASVVKAMIKWLYAGRIHIQLNGADATHSDNLVRTMCLRLFSLADKYQIPELQNDAIDAYLVHRNRHELVKTPIHEANLAYALTSSSSSPLRRMMTSALVADYGRNKGGNRDFLRVAPWMAHDVLMDFTERILAVPKSVRAVAEDFCERYHIHDASSGGKCVVLKPYCDGGEDQT
ncbi:hypothetical protein BP5796_11837 [Coleophoma crateriformis]|uniref:BTB domain-containing protein n=1 Tax=Coleophoma crateriformis TaxID=565419 RepID=A0A3D8QEV0_9HELO|nr:hypothetical protein BP5796_11837 [Coleophoma crateriformis]